MSVIATLFNALLNSFNRAIIPIWRALWSMPNQIGVTIIIKPLPQRDVNKYLSNPLSLRYIHEIINGYI